MRTDRQAYRHSDRPKYSPSPLGGAGIKFNDIREQILNRNLEKYKLLDWFSLSHLRTALTSKLLELFTRFKRQTMGLCWLLVKTRNPARFKVAPGRVRVLQPFPGSVRVPGTRRGLLVTMRLACLPPSLPLISPISSPERPAR